MRSRSSLTLAPLAASLLAVASVAAATPPAASASVAQKQAAVSALRSAIAADTRKIDAGTGGLAAAEARLAKVRTDYAAREQQLATVDQNLVRAREHLVALENRLQSATHALASNLVTEYEADPPDIVTVVLQSHGFADLLERLNFLKRVGTEDANIVGNTRAARLDVAHEAGSLASLEARDQRLAAVLGKQRSEAAALESALLQRHLTLLARRAAKASRLSGLRAQIHALEVKAAEEAVNPPAVGGIRINRGGAVQAPPGAPAAVAKVIAAGNAIATLPYLYGGGHASFQANAYDCSASVSYALAAAGLVTSPLDSTAFESWGDAGPGQWITVYANAGHAFMVVAGWRFDTVALAEGGTRWSRAMTSTAGYVARHPPGL